MFSTMSSINNVEYLEVMISVAPDLYNFVSFKHD